MATRYTSSFNDTLSSGVSIDSTRRTFNFGERIAELAPQQSPFFVYLQKVARSVTDDPVFKLLEQRHQWQRRNFEVEEAWDPGAEVIGTACDASDDLHISCKYDKYGRTTTTDNPCYFILPGQVIAIRDDAGDVKRFRLLATATVETKAGAAATDGTYICHDTTDLHTEITGECLIPIQTVDDADAFAAGNKGQVIGSAWAEGSTAPEGWEDKFYDREGYCQIFKTAINLFSGTALATRYRGVANEYRRSWQEKLMEHKMDIEHAVLFGVGAAATETAATTAPVRYTWGILPYTESYGKIYNFSYAASGYDAFLDAMEDYFAPESGNSGAKLVLASRKVITFLNKMGSNGFLDNTVGASQYRLDVTNIPGNFGHTVTKVNTIFGDLHFVAEPLLRGPWEDYAIAVDMKNVAYRPLAANGVNRDTFITTNIQDNDVDGRQDLITTEAGIEISLPETHAILKFS